MTTALATTARSDAPEAALSTLEWKVVSLAMREANDNQCGDTPRLGWFGRFLHRTAGIRPRLPLADPKLEALRRFVCGVQRRGDTAEHKARLIELGFEPAQIAAVAMLAR